MRESIAIRRFKIPTAFVLINVEPGSAGDVLEDLRRAKLVMRKKHKHGDPYRYFLNRIKRKEISALIEKFGETE